jgi:peptidoglycan-N-acetylmuramic acid deacetylase
MPGFPDTVNVINENGGVYADIAANKNGVKKLYLTFDAGYENGNIEKILDIMRDERVSGAFFILSNLIDKNPDLVKRMADEGHLVCNHTSNHKDLTKLTDDEIIANLKRLEDKYKSVTGYDMEKIFRFPEGRYSEHALACIKDMGYKTVFWSFAYDDWDEKHQTDPKKAMKKILENTHNGAVFLFHPTSTTNAKIFESLIKEWKNMGYSFGTLYELVE